MFLARNVDLFRSAVTDVPGSFTTSFDIVLLLVHCKMNIMRECLYSVSHNFPLFLYTRSFVMRHNII